jgi:hypothetical protein
MSDIGSVICSDDLPDFDMLTAAELKHEFKNERKRYYDIEKSLFKKQTQLRRLELEIKKLQDINTENANNTNNTSSQFSLPSEFKERWNEMVTELIMDAFPDFLDKYFLLVPLIHELFIAVRKLLEFKQQAYIEQIAGILNLN